jgi:MFS family permease
VRERHDREGFDVSEYAQGCVIMTAGFRPSAARIPADRRRPGQQRRSKMGQPVPICACCFPYVKHILRNMSFTSKRWSSDVYLATGARAASSCGDLMAATALVLALQQRGQGGFAVAAILIAAAAPPVLLVRWTGRLVDQADSRLLLVATGLAQAAACAALAFATGAAEIIALVAVLACGLAVTGPALAALLPAMAAPGDLPRVTALGQTASSVGIMIAPALGGVLTGQFGLRVPLLADAASYLAIAAAGRLIRTRRGRRGRRPAPAASAPAPRPADAGQADAGQAPEARDGAAADGWRVRGDPLLRPVIVLVGAVLAAVSLVNVAEVFFVRQDLHSTASAYGLLSTAWVGAAMAGGWLLGRRRLTDAGLGRILLGALALACLAVAVMAAVPDVGWLAPVNIIGGLGNGGLNVAAAVLLGRRAPPAARGRAFAVYSAVANGASVAGFLLGGLLLSVVSVRACIAAAGLFGLAITGVLARPLLRATPGGRPRAGGALSPLRARCRRAVPAGPGRRGRAGP